MRRKTITVYNFGELSKEAKDNARNEYFSDYNWSKEAKESLTALAKHFSCTIKNYSCCWDNSGHSYCKFNTDGEFTEEELKELIEALGEYSKESLRGNGECKLTGFGSDEDAIDGLRKAYLEGERDLEKLLQAGFRSWLKACQEDYENQLSDESIAETCEANDYEFNENGKII
jgi:hypothetical protein